MKAKSKTSKSLESVPADERNQKAHAEAANVLNYVRQRREELSPDVSYNLGQLAKAIKEDQNKILYWKKKGILEPVRTLKGNRPVDEYKRPEIEKAYLASKLSGENWPPQKIAGATWIWEHIDDPQPSRKSVV